MNSGRGFQNAKESVLLGADLPPDPAPRPMDAGSARSPGRERRLHLADRGWNGFHLPCGRSPVFYIGQSKNLRNRLQDHLQFATEARDHRRYPLYFQVYEYAARFGCRYTCISALSWDTPKELEADVMALFAKKFRCWPAANGVGSWDFVE